MRSSVREYTASLFVLVLAMLVGCQSYQPRPLPTGPDLLPAPSIPATQLRIPGLMPHAIPNNGLDEITIVTLAVLNNPELKAARLQAGVANAQVLQAGLLPDPQLGTDFATSALNYGGALSLSQDIQAMLTRGAAQAAANAAANQVNLNILWQEIQVAERARELFIQQQTNSKLREVLLTNQKLLQENYQHDKAAMERGDITAGTVSADLLTLADANAAVRQLQTDTNLTEHSLNALLGLQSNVQLHLIGTAQENPLSKAEFDKAIAALPQRRADLLALKQGYQSQEESLRRAIIAQFPALSAGVSFGRDPVEGVNSFGPQVSLSLPLFNRNRGQIAIERATREELRQQYQARLDAAVSQADEVWKASRILEAQMKDLDAQLPALQQTADAAEQSYRRNNIDAALYVSTRSSLLTRETELIRLQASLVSARSTLRVLLGTSLISPP